MDSNVHDESAAPPEPDAEGDQETTAPPPPDEGLPIDENTEGQVEPAEGDPAGTDRTPVDGHRPGDRGCYGR